MTPLEFLSPVLAQQAPAPGGGGTGTLIFMGLMFAAMYFLMIAPQRKKQKEHQKMLDALGAGDEIITAGGVYGQIVSKKDDRFIVRVGENTRIELGKGFVQAVVKKAEEGK